LLSSQLWLSFLLSGGPAAVDSHEVPIVPAAAVISDVNIVLAVVGLPACCLLLHYFCKHPRYCWCPCPVVAFIPVVACISAVVTVMLLLSSLLLLVAGVIAVAGIPVVAGVPLVSDVLTVAGLPAIVASLVLLAFRCCFAPAFAGVLMVAGVLAVASMPAHPGVPI
jgi:hypothetical protein